MHITVQEALSIYPLSEAKLVAGISGTSRILKSVNIMDAPDIADWIKPGEMLFTTAYLFKDSPEQAVHLMKKLNERGGVGLGIKLGRFWTDIPDTVKQEADRIQFPLLELPYQFTFSDQMNALFQAEYMKNTKALHTVLDKQKRLMQYALKHDDFMNIFTVLSEILELPLAVVGLRGQILYNSSDWTDSTILHNWPWEPSYQWFTNKQGICYRIPLVQNGDSYGFLLIMPQTLSSLKAEEGLFHQVAEMLSYQMGLSYYDYVNQTTHNELGFFMNQYLHNLIPIKELIERAKNRELSFLEGSFQCVLTTIHSTSPQIQSAKLLKQIHQELQFSPAMNRYDVQHFFVDEGIVSIYSLPGDRKASHDELSRFLLKTFGDWNKDGGTPKFYISRTKVKAESLYDAFQECVFTEQLGSQYGLNDTVLQYDTIEISYIYQHIPLEVMTKFCERILHPLLSKEEEYIQDMLRTLEAFIENDCSVNEAARVLFIHRNTVAYRLEKISDLLQVDFKNMNDLVKLRMLFMFRSYMKLGLLNE